MQTPSVVKAILDKIAGFFDILDLSFFVSGAVCLAGLVYAASPKPLVALEQLLDRGYKIGAALVASYVLGLVCFALGRWLRGKVTPRRAREAADGVSKRWAALAQLLQTHGLDRKEPYASYDLHTHDETFPHRMEALYTRLWVEMRQDKALAPSFELVRKYWVMAATCDGLVAALLVWAVAAAAHLLVAMPAGGGPSAEAIGVTTAQVLAFLVGVRMCIREAHRLSIYQAEEVVATLAHRCIPGPPPPPLQGAAPAAGPSVAAPAAQPAAASAPPAAPGGAAPASPTGTQAPAAP